MSSINLSNITAPSTGLTIGGGVMKTAAYNSLYFKLLTATNPTSIAINTAPNLTLSGFDSNFTSASSGTAVNVPAGIYLVLYSTSVAHPVQSSSQTFTQIIVNITGTGALSSQQAIVKSYPANTPTSAASSASDDSNLPLHVYFPVSGTLQFSFGNYLGSGLAANAVSATVSIMALKLF